MLSTSCKGLGFALLAGAAVVVAQSSARAELVVNGGFENAIPFGWTSLPSGGFSNFGTVGTQFHSGVSSAFFAHPFGQDDAFVQTLATTAGQSYTLSFWVFNAQQNSDHLRISFEGVQVFDALPLNIPLSQWTQVSTTITATLNGSQLRVAGYDIPDRFYVDDISVTQTPAPGAAALGAMATLFAARRRRR
jgi:MYXO-CTERM domain-containing protein